MADKKISALPAATTPLAGTEVLPVVQGGVTDKVSVANLTAGRAVSALSLSTTAGIVDVRADNGLGIRFLETTTGNSNRILLGTGSGFGYIDATAGVGSTYLSLQAGSVERAKLDTSGNLTVNTGNLVVGTAGKGIDFSANTHAAGMTSELLDWYEEGTWTPSFNQGFVAPVSYTTQTGKYTRIGDMVYFHAYIYMDAGQTRAAVALGLDGLPFPVASGSYVSVVWNYAAGVVAAGTALPTIYAGNVFYNTGGAPFLGTALTSARPEFAISGFYKTT